ncbi:hypothetical protein KKD04_01860 [Patescibacteria group bacterium]|nr:hypothetical protein [Patescibacteria group bacterium]
MSYFYDSYAIIEILERNENYLKFSEHIIITSTLNLFEVYYYLLIKHNKITADYWAKNLNLDFLEISPIISVEASKFRFDNKKEKLSLVDCVGYILALKNNLKFLTGDEKFKNKKNVEFVKK